MKKSLKKNLLILIGAIFKNHKISINIKLFMMLSDIIMNSSKNQSL
jgi:hypothetical protein